MLDGEEYSSSAAVTAECFSSLSTLLKKKNKGMNKKRFSDEQIRSLETMFEYESKLEPRQKLQLARELGLQPRQVAIWFQNKRARWKSKQLERDYAILLSNYNTLASQFETLKKEKQSLLTQLQKLNDLVGKSREESQCCREALASIDHGKIEKGHSTVKCEFEVKPPSLCLSFDRSQHDGVGLFCGDDSSIKAEYLVQLDEESDDLLNMADGSPENWGSLDSNDLLDQSASSNHEWFDFWC
ncbi:unnamed protein product [Ilex paraguariensis]|uniref:Homeobox-leucine zipper protein n=1 Tax=Ilex paraguariensis TaxID=185542 RepID=A0ABC8TC96_9AQUA